jgi:hypothetical protein
VKFGLIDAPPLQESFNVSGSLDWEAAHDASSCIASMRVVVTNSSKSKITVSKVRGRAWYLNEPSPASKPIRHFDFIDFSRKTPPQDEFVSLDGPLVQNYAPGQSSQHDFNWTVKRKEGAYALFRIEVFDKAGDDEPRDWRNEWDLVCDIKTLDQNQPVK